jgi:GT2 family glycosyltransferase
MMTAPPVLTVIVVNWNTKSLLRKCLRSVIDQRPPFPYEIIVVDNGSNDGSTDMIRTEFPQVCLIASESNLGFSKANNLALRRARGRYALLLNSDTVIRQDDVLSRWIDFMESTQDAGASGCRLLWPDGSHQVGDAGFRPTFSTLANFCLFLNRLSPRRHRALFLGYKSLDGVMRVDWVTGADLMVRTSIIADVGLLDEETFMYAEDIEWGCRTSASGYNVYYLPQLEIVHMKGASTALHGSTEMSTMWLSNLRRLYRDYNQHQPIVIYDVTLALGFLLRTGIYYGIYAVTGNDVVKARARAVGAFFRQTIAQTFRGNRDRTVNAD